MYERNTCLTGYCFFPDDGAKHWTEEGGGQGVPGPHAAACCPWGDEQQKPIPPQLQGHQAPGCDKEADTATAAPSRQRGTSGPAEEGVQAVHSVPKEVGEGSARVSGPWHGLWPTGLRSHDTTLEVLINQ